MEEKRKYLEYFDEAFDFTVAEKMKPENKPYVAYSKTEGVVYTVIPEEPTSAYQMVDLGLPSGIKWADRNVGAENPQDSGLYFSWGNIEGHTVDENGNVTDGYSFDKNTYATTLGGQYTGSTLDAEHDAVKVNMGEEWYMPTIIETQELYQFTVHYYIGEDGNIVAGPFNFRTNYSYKGLDGSALRSICFVKKGEDFDYNNRSNFIEFPFSGRSEGSLLGSEGLRGYIWSSSIHTNVENAYDLFFNSEGKINSNNGICSRYKGLPVRGVQP